MRTTFLPTTICCALLLMTVTLPARAQFAVIDVGTIAQLIKEVEQLQQQIQLAQSTLTQAQRSYSAITGGRGMDLLLGSIDRNYLPTNWAQLQAAVAGGGGPYGALSADINATVLRNSVLTSSTIKGMDPSIAAALDARRRSAALLESLARRALANTSNHFSSIQQLTNAMRTATDEKAILDLQARIGIEASMLQNENIKLQELYKAAQVAAETERLRADELAISSIGSLAALPPMGLN